jgi:aquaporin NIP
MVRSLLARMAAELIGTFGFFFLGFMGIVSATTRHGSIQPIGISVGFGGGLAMMIFALGHISGGHFNPAVTFGLASGGRFRWLEVPAYWLSQVAGGLAAAGLVRGLFTGAPDALISTPGRTVSEGTAFLVEAIATALFLLVISTVATDDRAPWHGVLAPVAIGGFIVVIASVIGPISSGSLNPARSLAPAIVAQTYSHLWVFIVGPLVGGAIGGIVGSWFRRSRGTARQAREPEMVE